jgi:ATP/ADP translocase
MCSIMDYNVFQVCNIAHVTQLVSTIKCFVLDGYTCYVQIEISNGWCPQNCAVPIISAATIILFFFFFFFNNTNTTNIRYQNILYLREVL